jgi:hypothetical protein
LKIEELVAGTCSIATVDIVDSIGLVKGQVKEKV